MAEASRDLNNMRIQSKQVSLEAFSGGDIKSLLTNTFPGIVEDVKSFFNKFSPNEPGIGLTSNEYAFIKDLSKHSYLDISPLTAYVPEGLDVTYLEYSEVLLGVVDHSVNILSILGEYSAFISQLINNNDGKLSTSPLLRQGDLEKARAKLNSELGKCFKHGSTKAEVNIGTVIKRNADWEHVFKNTAGLSKLINSVDRKFLNKKIQECATLLDVVIEKSKRGELEGMSPQALSNLSSGVYQVASELEFFSITYFRVLAFTTSVDRTIKHFEEVFDK